MEVSEISSTENTAGSLQPLNPEFESLTSFGFAP